MYNKIIIKTPADEITFDSNFHFIDGEGLVCLEFEENDEAYSWFKEALRSKVYLKSIKIFNENKSVRKETVRMIKSIQSGTDGISVYLIK